MVIEASYYGLPLAELPVLTGIGTFRCAAAVGYAIRFVFCSSTVAVLFFDSVLFGQDVGESTRGAAHRAAPLHGNMTDYLAYLGKIILPMGAVRYPRISPSPSVRQRCSAVRSSG